MSDPPNTIVNAFLYSDDVPRLRAFYEQLGWTPAPIPGDVFAVFPLAGVRLCLFDPSAAPGSTRVAGLALDVFVDGREQVAPALERAQAAGGRVIDPGDERPYGYSGYVLDPAGTPWQFVAPSDAGDDAPPPPSNGALPARLDAISLSTPDVLAQRVFLEALGFPCATEPGRTDIAQHQHGGGIVSGWVAHEAAAEIGTPLTERGHAFHHFTLAVAVDSAAEVDAGFAAVRAAGAQTVVTPTDHWWGGRSGYFADPDGNPWEIVWIPGAARDRRGTLTIPATAGG